VVAAPAGAADKNSSRTPTAAELATHFYRTAVFREYAGERIGILKWVDGPSVAVVGSTTPERLRQLSELLGELFGITGLRFMPAETGGGTLSSSVPLAPVPIPVLTGPLRSARWTMAPVDARSSIELLVEDGKEVKAISPTMLILFQHRADILGFKWPDHATSMIQRLAESKYFCIAYLLARVDTLAISTALIVIPTDQPDWIIRRCINEEIAQSLGLTTDVPGSRLTLFNKEMDPNWTELTQYDRLFLKILYHPEVKIGAQGDPLMEIVYRLIREELRSSR
jgi:hypothetical protein